MDSWGTFLGLRDIFFQFNLVELQWGQGRKNGGIHSKQNSPFNRIKTSLVLEIFFSPWWRGTHEDCAHVKGCSVWSFWKYNLHRACGNTWDFNPPQFTSSWSPWARGSPTKLILYQEINLLKFPRSSYMLGLCKTLRIQRRIEHNFCSKGSFCFVF